MLEKFELQHTAQVCITNNHRWWHIQELCVYHIFGEYCSQDV